MNPTDKPVVKSYRDLLVWQKSMDLVEAVYRVAKKLPASERYGLTAQMQRGDFDSLKYFGGLRPKSSR